MPRRPEASADSRAAVVGFAIAPVALLPLVLFESAVREAYGLDRAEHGCGCAQASSANGLQLSEHLDGHDASIVCDHACKLALKVGLRQVYGGEKRFKACDRAYEKQDSVHLSHRQGLDH
jgi:hypothetical protein